MWMILSAGEIFQHAHGDPSITMLVEGAVQLEVPGSRTALIEGDATSVDANVPHVLINVGQGLAIVKCVHLQTDSPMI